MENNQTLFNQKRKSILLNKTLMEGKEKKLIELSDTINGFENETDFFSLCEDLKTLEYQVLTNGLFKIKSHLASYQNYGNVIQSLSIMAVFVTALVPLSFADVGNDTFSNILAVIISISLLVILVSLAKVVQKHIVMNDKIEKITYLKLIIEQAIKEKTQV